MTRKKLLILDDNAPFSESLSDLLTQQGFSARWTTLADEAFIAARADRPDILIIDVTLVTRSGLDVARQFWNERLTTAIIFLTGKVEFDIANVPAELKAKALVLHKPVDKETLLDAIANLTPAAAGSTR